MRQRGSIFFTLFGTVALVGVLGTMMMSMLRGPVATAARVTDATMAKNDMLAASITISERTLKGDASDCDQDGTIEPISYRAGGHAPVGGGFLPPSIGVTMRDPWKTEYGYCVWDHGYRTRSHNVAACGGNAAGRLNGANADTEAAIAIISAGPNRLFETTCRDWAMPNVPLVETSVGSDDIVRVVPYGQFLMPSSAQARVEELPDAACTQASVGLMRLMLGVMQVCTEGGWIEISPASGGDVSFHPVTNAAVGSAHQSNTVTFGTLSAPMPVSINNGGSLSINGGGPMVSGTVNSGNTLRLSGAAPSAPEATNNYTVQIGTLGKIWSITTRDAYVGNLSMTPAVRDSMTVTGPGAPAYGATTGFIVTNNGERATGMLVASATLSGSASGWSCSLPWGGKLANGGTVVAYATPCALLSCTSQVRKCTNASLSGTFQHQTCNVLLSCL